MDQGESPESAGGSGQNDLQYDRPGVPASAETEDHHGLLTTRSYFSQQLRIYSLQQLRIYSLRQLRIYSLRQLRLYSLRQLRQLRQHLLATTVAIGSSAASKKVVQVVMVVVNKSHYCR